jgi:hypothetical protein
MPAQVEQVRVEKAVDSLEHVVSQRRRPGNRLPSAAVVGMGVIGNDLTNISRDCQDVEQDFLSGFSGQAGVTHAE